MGTFIPFMVNTYKEKLYSLCEELLNIEEINMADNAVLLLRKYANMRLNDIASQMLKFKIISLIRRIRSGNILSVDQEEITRYKSTKVYAEAKTVYMYLVENYDLLYEEGEIAYLSYIILTESTDINPVSETDFDDEKLLNVVAEIVNVAFNQLNIRESEIETLSKELFSHLKITLNRFELNIISENPILEQIKAKYGDVFEVVKKASAIFKNEYGFELSEDEIGFITMYFLKSLEKSKTHIKKNIIVVCNTSRGTSKLLATRIKNNITEVNIKNIVSIIDIENDKELLEDIDLIISTIKISNIGKPTITVSPIITNYELTKIRDFLYLKDEYVSGEKDEKNYIDDTLTSIIEKYTQKKNVGKLHREIMSLMGSFSNIMMNDKEKENYSMEAELTGLILVEISDMILRLYPSGINQEEFKKVCGIMIHIVMAIPRWQKGEYNPEKNIKGYEQMYPERFKIIEETFNRISDKYKIFIKRTEIVAILRYMI
jgi:mannitol operon transcriptional antiterminator